MYQTPHLLNKSYRHGIKEKKNTYISIHLVLPLTEAGSPLEFFSHPIPFGYVYRLQQCCYMYCTLSTFDKIYSHFSFLMFQHFYLNCRQLYLYNLRTIHKLYTVHTKRYGYICAFFCTRAVCFCDDNDALCVIQSASCCCSVSPFFLCVLCFLVCGIADLKMKYKFSHTKFIASFFLSKSFPP